MCGMYGWYVRMECINGMYGWNVQMELTDLMYGKRKQCGKNKSV